MNHEDIIILIVAGVFIALGIRSIFMKRKMKLRCTEKVQGVLFDVSVESAGGMYQNPQENTSNDWIYFYQYTIDGNIYKSVCRSRFRLRRNGKRIKENDEVTIYYDPRKHSESFLAADWRTHHFILSSLFFFIIGGLIILGYFVVMPAWLPNS